MNEPVDAPARAWSMLEQGREPEALALLTDLLAREPSNPAANRLMALIHGAHGRHDQAARHLRRAILTRPADPELHLLLGNVLFAQRLYRDAGQAYRACIRLQPANPDAHDGLARSLISTDQFTAGMAAYRAAIDAAPNDPTPFAHLCNTLIHLGRQPQALDAALEGLSRHPGETQFALVAAVAMNYTDADPIEHRRMHEVAGAALARASAGRTVPERIIDRDPARPLRVAFLSGDFGSHVCSTFMAPLLTNFDPGRIAPFCYATRPPDGTEGPFRAACRYREVHALSDEELASLAASDEIDILVECSGVTDGNRLSALTPRIAPIQCTWLGYPNTTGLATIDYRIVDAITDLPGAESHSTERLARLPGCFLCWRPTPAAPTPTLSPATLTPDSREPIVFGSFNRLSKISPRALDTWCTLLRECTNSRLLLKVHTLSAQQRAELLNEFTGRGMNARRIDLAQWTLDPVEHARMYCRMDIALDPFPYNGTTTTCEAAWMGVPTIALEGPTHRARVGASLNTALGLGDLIARDPDEYVRIAAKLANDRPRLRTLKLGMRARMAASPLRDEPGYARKFEHLLRNLWQRWCSAG